MLEKLRMSAPVRLRFRLNNKLSTASKDKVQNILRVKHINRTVLDLLSHLLAMEMRTANHKVNTPSQWDIHHKGTATCTTPNTQIHHTASNKAKFTSNVSEADVPMKMLLTFFRGPARPLLVA